MKNRRGRAPNGATVSAMLIVIEEGADGKKRAKLVPVRVKIDKIFPGMGMDIATKVKNLRHMQGFSPQMTIMVIARGQPPIEVPLNRLRIDPTNTVEDHPGLVLFPFGNVIYPPPHSSHVSQVA